MPRIISSRTKRTGCELGCPANLGCLTVDGLTAEQSVVISLSNDRKPVASCIAAILLKNFNFIFLYRSNSAICVVSQQVRYEARPLPLRSPNLMSNELSCEITLRISCMWPTEINEKQITAILAAAYRCVWTAISGVARRSERYGRSGRQSGRKINILNKKKKVCAERTWANLKSLSQITLNTSYAFFGSEFYIPTFRNNLFHLHKG